MQRFLKYALAAAALASLTACGGGGTNPNAPATPAPVNPLYVAESGLNQVAVLDMATGAPITTIAVGTSPKKLSYNYSTGIIWVANSGSGTVSKIDTKTNSVVATITVGSKPVSLVAQLSGDVYVANQGSNSVSIIDPGTDKIIATLPTSGTPFAIVDAHDDIAVAETNSTVEFIDVASRTIAGKITMQSRIESIIGTGAAFATGIVTSDGVLHKYDLTNYGLPWVEVEQVTLPNGAGPASDNAWERWLIVNQSTGMLQDINPTAKAGYTSQSIKSYKVGTAPEYAAFTDLTGDIYVPNAGSDSITVIDILDRKPIATWNLQSGATPYDIALAFNTNLATPAPTPVPTATPTATPKPSPSPAATPTPVPTPTGTPVATSGQLYVANQDGNDLQVYTAPLGATSQASSSLGFGTAIYGVASSNGSVAIADALGAIHVFATPVGQTSPVNFQAGSEGGLLAFDATGNLYLTTQSNAVLKFTPPFTATSGPSQIISGISSDSFGIAFDAQDTMYVSNLGSAVIDVLTPPYTAAPAEVIAPGSNVSIVGLTVNAGRLFASDPNNGKIYVYSLPLNASSTPAFAISTRLPHATAFDSQGNMYVSNDGDSSIDVFNAPITASSTKSYSITAGIVHPLQLTFGR